VLTALAVGCAVRGCESSSNTPEATAESDAPDETATASGPAQADEGGAPTAELPVLSDEALAARVAAQTRLLGRKALFEDSAGKPVPALEVSETEGTLEDDILDALPGSSGISVVDEDIEERANGNALGLYVPIENPKQPALAHFHQALRDLAEGKDEDGKVRILAYGASHTQADIYTEYMRSYLQDRFGNGGVGFVSLVRVAKWHRPYWFSIDSSKKWTVEHAQRRDARDDGLFGLLGASASATKKREWTKLSPNHPDSPTQQGGRYEIFYLAQPGGGKFTVHVDGSKQGTVNTKAATTKAGYYAFDVDASGHEVEVKHAGGGEIRVFGLTNETDTSGIVVDTLGISGTRLANQLKWDEAVWADNVKKRQPDLYTFAFGTNESTDEDQPIGTYRKRLVEVLERFRRAAPEASCLLIGPGDSARQLEEGVWVTRPRLLQIRETQRDVAWEQGCAFWDGIAFMGGVGSMHQWANSKPRMASRDHIHLSRRGYVRMGMAITDAIMAEFDTVD
jgi:lysophospholipase L1-like esterase